MVFFTACAVYTLIGLTVFFRNTKYSLNRVLLLMCLSLSIWAFCFSIVNSAPDQQAALLWRNLSALGWGVMHSFSLHFLIILTENNRIFKRKWLYIPLYLPAAVNIFVFTIAGLIDSNWHVYHLFRSQAGWVNESLTVWDWYFNVYFISFAVIGFYLLFRWGWKSVDFQKRKQTRLLLISYGVAMVLGALTDNFLNLALASAVPQMGVVFTLIPIMAIVYSMKRYGLMKQERVHIIEPGQILSDVNLLRFYDVLSLVFILGAALNFAALYFFYHTPLSSVLGSSLILFAYGLIIRIIRYLPRKSLFQETSFIVLVAAAIPLITLRFMNTAGVTVWAMPFIFLTLSVVYNKRRMMYAVALAFLVTEIVLWTHVPEALVRVEASDYIGRIGIFAITIWLAYYVNEVYIQRLKENEMQISFQKMLLEISAEFRNVTETDLDDKINVMLALCGEYFQVDRTILVSLSPGHRTHEWKKTNGPDAAVLPDDVSENSFLWWRSQMEHKKIIEIQDVDMLPSEAAEEKAFLGSKGIRSLIALTVMEKDMPSALLSFGSTRNTKIWRDDHKEMLRILVNMLSDAIAKVEAEKEISYMAYYDSLTGLPNRTLYLNRLRLAIEAARRSGEVIGVVVVDLDSFKAVNDTIGHPGGDEMLMQMAKRLAGCLRKYDTVSRFGGDEFLILLTRINSIDDIQKIVDKIMYSFTRPLTLRGQEFFITASAGIAVFPTDGEDAVTLVRNADQAMYNSKENGKNQSTIFSLEKKEELLQKAKLTNSLHRALERDELELFYQPQVDVVSRRVIGCEALIRWHHPELGLVSPVDFISIAEKNGLIDPIGKWVLRTACRQTKLWQQMGLPPLRMAVNLSVEQFRKKDIVEVVSNTLRITGLESQFLELEITESTIIIEADYIVAALEELKRLGVTIAIDDFGTHYSSLSRLKNMPLDRLKIDIQFVRGIPENKKDEAIAKTIIQLARNLSLHVIAEGVETKEQYEFFRQQHCDEIQGYYFFKPMPAAELEAILLEQGKQ